MDHDDFSEKALLEVMSASEAAALWGKAPITVQQACKGYGNIHRA